MIDGIKHANTDGFLPQQQQVWIQPKCLRIAFSVEAKFPFSASWSSQWVENCSLSNIFSYNMCNVYDAFSYGLKVSDGLL
jgi:hypothetical protein